ncbi:two component transcriptional regulator, LytTR family [Filimonas lacunae]|uniref:Two component transcriptional regulator, LytTR family n=2 Tax=Filimonas lacunae TaxID=477680 RepID=A0A173MJC6_9BACT|nr:two-component system response regulator [Filimonas lacunae]SIT29866.1 two component transcriptional regulator, LytTR family [Filimonas lacunae]
MVIDDEPLAVKLLADYIRKTPGLELVYSTTKVLEALPVLEDGGIDLLFLDIQMPELTGLQLIKVLGPRCKVVLTTAYQEYALQSYEYDVADYLLKPVTFDRFALCIQKVRSRLQETTPQPVASAAYIFVKTEYRVQKVTLDSLLYIEALRDYIAFHTTEEKILSLESMRHMEEVLPAQQFIRIHKSYIINKDNIDFLERGKVVIRGQYLPIGDTYKEIVQQKIKPV